MARLVFLGLDGATWDVLDPLVRDGHLPTLQRLVDEGCSGGLESTRPPVTFPAWRVLSSGKNPGKLGVYGWNHPDFEARRFVYPNSTDYRTRDVWDYLNADGLSTAVVNQPGTYPPMDVDGLFVSGPESQGDDIIRPLEKRPLLERYARHTHGLATYLDRGDLPRVVETIETNLAFSASIAPEVDVLHHVVFLTDTAQHHLWDDPDALRQVWQAVDRGLGELLDEAQPETVLVASDHGFQPLEHLLSVNEALAEAGLATLDPPRGASVLGRLGIDRARVLRLAAGLGITEATLAKLPGFLKDRVPEQGGGLGARRDAAVDWEATVALTGDGRGIHLRDPDQADAVAEVLLALEDDQGEPLIEAVVPANEAWHGPYLGRAPDLLVQPRHGVEPGGSLGQGVLRDPVPGKTWIAHHHPTGVFLAWGEGIRQGTVDGARIEDVCPTMLASVGSTLPTDLDGSVLDVFTNRPSLGTREPLPVATAVTPYSDEEAAKVQERLEDLGYL